MSSARSLLRQPIIHVKDDGTLKNYCAHWLQCRLLAIDTEFMRVDTYYPIASLIQVNDGDKNYLLDPLTISDWSYFTDVMTSPNVIKAFHACSEDLDVFNNLIGALPVKMFDTQIAAALLGIGASVGYGNLVNECLDVLLPKGETRSNWLARPLSDAQVHYAALDVDYLFELAILLEKKLNALGRKCWIFEESDAAIANYQLNLNPASGFLKSNNTWRLKPKALVYAKKLFEWREITAREKNIPKSRILKDAQIFDMLSRMPTNASELKTIGLHDSTIRKFGRSILDIITTANTDVLQIDIEPCELPLTKPERDRVKNLREWVSGCAATHNIAAEILVKKTIYQNIVRNLDADVAPLPALKKSTQGWRKTFFDNL